MHFFHFRGFHAFWGVRCKHHRPFQAAFGAGPTLNAFVEYSLTICICVVCTACVCVCVYPLMPEHADETFVESQKGGSRVLKTSRSLTMGILSKPYVVNTPSHLTLRRRFICSVINFNTHTHTHTQHIRYIHR